MTHTDKTTVVALAIMDVLGNNKASLGLDNIYYGEQANFPQARCVAVRGGRKTREIAGVAGPGGRVMNHMVVTLRVYNSRVTDEATGRLEIDQLVEDIEDVLHADTTLGGVIIHGFVSSIDPNYVFRPGSQFRSLEMIYEAISKTNLTQ